MKQKLVALFLIIMMAASALTAAGLATTTTVAAATATQTTLTVSKTTVNVGQQVTVTATPKSGTKVLAGKTVSIWHQFNGVRSPSDTINITRSNGKFSFTTKWTTPGTRYYYASLAGDSAYKASTSHTVTVTARIPTALY